MGVIGRLLRRITSDPVLDNADATLARYLDADGLPCASIEIAGDYSKVLESQTESLKAYLERTVKGSQEEIEETYAHAGKAPDLKRNGCELVSDILRVRRDFHSAGFSVSFSPPLQEKERQQFDAAFLEHEIRRVVEQLFWDMGCCDNAVLVWQIDAGALKYVQTLPAYRCSFSNKGKKPVLKVKLSSDVRREITNALAMQETPNYDEKYVEAVRNGQDYIELSESDGEYWVVWSDGAKYSGFARPSMRTVFLSILLREHLEAGDFAIAYYTKHLIQHFQIGESMKGTTSPQFPPDYLYPKRSDMTTLKTEVQKAGQNMRLVTNHAVNVSYVFPDPKVFSPDKYLKCDERILAWGGVPEVLLTGKGTGYGQGTLGLRRFQAQGDQQRAVVRWFMTKFFTHESIRQALGLPDDAHPVITFSEKIYREWKEIMDDMRFQIGSGGMAWAQYHEAAGWDHMALKAGMSEQQGEQDLWRPTFEAKQGLLSDGGPGRHATNPEATPVNQEGK
jgi:hypothetical protein